MLTTPPSETGLPDMHATQDILVVDDSLERTEIAGALKIGGYRVTSAATFEQATEIMAGGQPDLLVTELRLGAFNGLHLIIRSRAHKADTVAVVHTAHPDPVLKAEALRLNAEYFERPVDVPTLLTVIAQRLGRRPERRSSARTQVSEQLQVCVAGSSAALVDISDQGCRIRLKAEGIRSPLKVSFPSLSLAVSARIVWAQRPPHDHTSCVCGVEVDRVDKRSAEAWQLITKNI